MARCLFSIAASLCLLASSSCLRVRAVDEEQAPTPATQAHQTKDREPTTRRDAAAGPAVGDTAEPSRAPIEVADPVAKVSPQVTLSSPGNEPRAALRLRPTVGAHELATLRMGMVVGMQIGTTDVPPRRIPSIEAQLRVEILEVSDDAIRHRIETLAVEVVGNADASDRVQAAVDRAVERMRDTRGIIVVTNRGRIESIDLEIPDEHDASLRPTLEGFRQAFHQMFVWLPEEAVGPGARWKTITHVVQNELEIQQETQYHLVARQGDRVELEYELTQRAVEGATLQTPLPGGALAVDSHAATGSGRVVLDLGRVMPASGDAKSAGATRTRIAMGGAPETVLMQLDLDLTLQAP